MWVGLPTLLITGIIVEKNARDQETCRYLGEKHSFIILTSQRTVAVALSQFIVQKYIWIYPWEICVFINKKMDNINQNELVFIK